MEKKKKRVSFARGEMTSSTLITVILLVTGFAILLFIFYEINWKGQLNNEVCHSSVVLRATAPSIAQGYVPLKCQTSKLCVTSGLIGGKCEDTFGNKASGITKIKATDAEQIEKLVSEQIVGCWKMMGEGKVSLFSQYIPDTYGFGKIYPTCVICSRIAFDKNSNLDLSNMNVLRYMQLHKMPESEVSYFKYLSGGAQISVEESLIVDSNIVFDEDGNPVSVSKDDSVTITQDSLKDSFDEKNPKQEIAVLFMQISAPGHSDSILNIGKLFVGAGITTVYFAGPSLVTKAISAVGLKGALIALGATILGIGAQQINVAISRGVAAGYCGDISVGKDARNGCSVVRTVNYNLEDISKYCSVIESIA